MHKVHVTKINTLTGEIRRYEHKQKFKSPRKAVKLTRELMDEIDRLRPVPDEYEYTIEAGKEKR
ncbi:hypothetical protein FD670_16975 [Salmonella enterica]|nr:hypothetical protein [Salmonella enterica]EBS5590981.1 hypothetical protein [Salmonella enterica subsp. enterica serovar Newport]EBW9123551.1 hypothetical protein [Salmonella enterica subsp. enterica serovar Newport]EJF3976057.1 hypothetical protein [Salmonella enterica]